MARRQRMTPSQRELYESLARGTSPEAFVYQDAIRRDDELIAEENRGETPSHWEDLARRMFGGGGSEGNINDVTGAGSEHAQRMRDAYLAPMLESGREGIRGSYERSRDRVRDVSGRKGRQVINNAAARGLGTSGATRGMLANIDRIQHDRLMGLDTEETNALARLLQMAGEMDIGITGDEMQLMLVPHLLAAREREAQIMADAAESEGWGRLAGAALGNPYLTKLGGEYLEKGLEWLTS